MQTPLSPMRFQSQLGKETKRMYKEGMNVDKITLARVVKVNYKYNTVDVITTLHKNTTVRNPRDEGKYSARLPVSMGGKLPNGNVYGSTTTVTVGTLVLIGFLEGSKDYPIVLSIYGDTDHQAQLARTPYEGADETDENIQKDLWQTFNLYPSLTYKNVDGNGNTEVTFPGRTFMIVSDRDQEGAYIQDTAFDYDHLPSSHYASGDLIEPKSPDAPTVLYVHQSVNGNHRTTFFIKPDGTVRVGSRHKDGEGVTFQQLSPNGSFTVTQKKDTSDPEDDSNKFSEMTLTEQGEIILGSQNHTLEIRNDGVYVDGEPIGSIGGGGEPGEIDPEIEKQLEEMNKRILDMNASIEVVDGKIEAKADATIVNDMKETIEYHSSQFTVAFDAIESRVTYEEYNINNERIEEYTQELIDGVNAEISDVQEALTDLDGYIDGAFKDGIIEESEAQAIQRHIAELNVQKRDVDSQYIEIYANPYLPDGDKSNLEVKKDAFDNSHQQLIDVINLVISDGKVTPEEVEAVDRSFDEYSLTKADLTKAFETAINIIGEEKAKEAQFNAEEYADDLKKLIDEDIDSVSQAVTNLDEYVDGAFHDGIIEESEAQAISKYINSLNTEKLDVDERYQQLHESPYLPEAEKTELEDAKTSYDTAYSNLISSIQTAIADGKTTPQESQDVDNKFDEYSRTISALSAAFEKSVDAIASAKAKEAEENAKNDAEEGYLHLESEIIQLKDSITNRVTRDEVKETVDEIESKRLEAEKEINSRIDETNKEVERVKEAVPLRSEIVSTNGNIFKNGVISTTLFCRVYKGDDNITDSTPASAFNWTRVSDDTEGDADWNNNKGRGKKSVEITSDDVMVRATFSCTVNT